MVLLKQSPYGDIRAMELKDYLAELTPDERQTFADACESSVGHIKNIGYGYKPCAEKLAIAIEKNSGGKVRCEDLRPDVDWQFLRDSDAAERSKAV